MSTEKRIVTIQNVKPNAHDVPIFITPFVEQGSNGERVFKVGTEEYEAMPFRDRNNEIVAYETKPGCPLHMRTDRAFAYRNNDQFDLNNPAEAIQLQLIIDQGKLAKSDERPNPNQHRFFIKDKFAEAERTVDHASNVSMAMAKLQSLTQQDFYDIAFVERQPVKAMTKVEVDAFVWNLATTRPKRVLELAEDKSFKVRAFLGKLIQYGILNKTAGGIKFGTDVIGLDEDAATAWLARRENNQMVQLFRDELDKKIPGGEKEFVATVLEESTGSNAKSRKGQGSGED